MVLGAMLFVHLRALFQASAMCKGECVFRSREFQWKSTPFSEEHALQMRIHQILTPVCDEICLGMVREGFLEEVTLVLSCEGGIGAN